MKTFPAIFKSVYDEALLDLGFKRAKGRHLYYIRMVGDEIAHIITYTNEQNTKTVWRKSDKVFVVRGGVATVYRKKLTIDESPYANAGWLSTNQRMYFGLHPHAERNKYTESISEFTYDKDSEDSMYEVAGYSLETTKQIMLPILDEVQDLKKCLDYFCQYQKNLCIYPEEFLGQTNSKREYEQDFNEGILYLKACGVDEFISRSDLEHKENVKDWKYQMETGNTGMDQESFEEFLQMLENGTKRHIEEYLSLANDPDKMAKVKIELERRKKQNTELLSNLIK